VDIVLFEKGLHNEPADLRARLQDHVTMASAQKYDYVVMGYGLCGQATAGLTAVNIPLVVPRAHDCITLFLGSRARYQEQFENYPGTYWYVQDYIERSDSTGGALALGADSNTGLDKTYEEFVAKYGRDNADYLMEVLGAWKQHYKRAAYIDMGVADGSAVEAQAREEATRRGWIFDRLAGDLVLIRRLVYGDWQHDFLILRPGEHVTMTYDADVIGCARPAAG